MTSLALPTSQLPAASRFVSQRSGICKNIKRTLRWSVSLWLRLVSNWACSAARHSQVGEMPKSLPLLHQLWIKLGGTALALSGFWLVPEDPALPALLLTAVALPLALLGGLALWIVERREKARRKAAIPQMPPET